MSLCLGGHGLAWCPLISTDSHLGPGLGGRALVDWWAAVDSAGLGAALGPALGAALVMDGMEPATLSRGPFTLCFSCTRSFSHPHPHSRALSLPHNTHTHPPIIHPPAPCPADCASFFSRRGPRPAPSTTTATPAAACARRGPRLVAFSFFPLPLVVAASLKAPARPALPSAVLH